MEDRLLKQNTNMRVVECVHRPSPVPLADYEAKVAQKAELVGYGGLLHPDRLREISNTVRGLKQARENAHAARCRQCLHRLGNLARHLRVDRTQGRTAGNVVTHRGFRLQVHMSIST